METIKDLKDIAEVIAGYSFRTALHNKANASSFVLQAKNILDDSMVDMDNLDGIDFENYRSRAIVKNGDVVISSRGSFRAGSVKLENENTKEIIASSSVYILRLKKEIILSKYLAIYLNSIEGQKKLNERATGAAIKSIRRNDLENMSIALPNIETQNKIIEIYNTDKELQKVLSKKINLVKDINEIAINKLLNK
ncbi:MAG: restriction endonuclease subunit S [Candidatus Moraniibacteriota bacterium]